MSINVVVADDNPFYLSSVSLMLGSLRDFNVVAAVDSGAAAWAAVERGGVDLLIADIVLEGMSVYGILKRLEGMPQAPKTLVITSLSEEIFRSKTLELGAAAFERKPITGRELLHAIKEALSLPSLNIEFVKKK